MRCDVVVLGSGAGGAAATWQLSRMGLDVLCLETGDYYQEKDFSQDFGVASRQLYEDDGQRIMKGNLFIPVAGGKCVGGSTLVNSGISFRIPEWTFESWSKSAQFDFGFADFLPYIETTESIIQVQASKATALGKNNHFCIRGLKKLGWSGGPMPRNAPNCIGCGACHTGCPSGAKLSVAKNFLPQAADAGARILPLARGESAILEGDRVVGVRASLLNRADETVRGEIEVRSKAVVLACGAIQTPVFLRRNGLGNAHVGEHLHVHPGTGAMGMADELIEGWRGIPQGFYCDEFLKSDAMILESFWATPEFYFMSFPFGHEGTERILDFDRVVALGGTIADTSEGSVRPHREPGRAIVRYDVNDEDKQRLVRLERRVCEILIAAGGKDLACSMYDIPLLSTMKEVDRWLDPETIRIKQLMAVYSSHPHGTARMGADGEQAAVGLDGQLHGHPGLYVMDASLFPEVLGVNPQITIMSLALMLSERLGVQLTA